MQELRISRGLLEGLDRLIFKISIGNGFRGGFRNPGFGALRREERTMVDLMGSRSASEATPILSASFDFFTIDPASSLTLGVATARNGRLPVHRVA